jgi:hypothetical protein
MSSRLCSSACFRAWTLVCAESVLAVLRDNNNPNNNTQHRMVRKCKTACASSDACDIHVERQKRWEQLVTNTITIDCHRPEAAIDNATRWNVGGRQLEGRSALVQRIVEDSRSVETLFGSNQAQAHQVTIESAAIDDILHVRANGLQSGIEGSELLVVRGIGREHQLAEFGRFDRAWSDGIGTAIVELTSLASLVRSNERVVQAIVRQLQCHLHEAVGAQFVALDPIRAVAVVVQHGDGDVVTKGSKVLVGVGKSGSHRFGEIEDKSLRRDRRGRSCQRSMRIGVLLVAKRTQRLQYVSGVAMASHYVSTGVMQHGLALYNILADLIWNCGLRW